MAEMTYLSWVAMKERFVSYLGLLVWQAMEYEILEFH
jgi:hypothetical protein